ncbi:MAG: 1-deoxy-D-xylulose-5-phosphate reductoisomerase [Rhodospirillaceae bacterium]
MVVKERKRISILGSTGSVGRNTLDIVKHNPGQFEVIALTAGCNVQDLIDQAITHKPKVVAIADASAYSKLKDALEGTAISVAAGPDAVIEAAEQPADLIMAAIVGAAGLKPTLTAVAQGKIVALANKECLVSAGSIFMNSVKRHSTTLLPVDSEHSAIFQVFDAKQRNAIRRIILTASGGPFRQLPADRMANVLPSEAIAHPNWSMGSKISVDSATMMNKGLELIEAHHLFAMPDHQIDILVHPQSVVHSLVEYVDGSVLAQLGAPDMRTPIAYALGWPNRLTVPCERLDLAQIAKLTFEAPDSNRFPALSLARSALQAGGTAPTILNAANEVSVARFLAGEIGFLDIARAVENALAKGSFNEPSCLDEVLEVDAEARQTARNWIAVEPFARYVEKG